jgi:hypothetical protein
VFIGAARESSCFVLSSVDTWRRESVDVCDDTNLGDSQRVLVVGRGLQAYLVPAATAAAPPATCERADVIVD